MEINLDAPIFLPPEEIVHPDAVFRNSCRRCLQKFNVKNIEPFTHFDCPHCGAILTVPRLFGDYWLMTRLSNTGSARLYGAIDPLLDRQIVIKVTKIDKNDQELSEQWRRRLYYDAQIQCQLEHPNVVEIYRCCQLESHNFKVMELLPGGQLRFSDDPEQRTDSILALSSISETVSLLNTAADFKLFHGCIIPKHLIFNGEGTLKLLNFRPPDTAWLPIADEEFIYFSPERLLDFEISAAADIYSIGVILYQLFTNRHPLGTVAGLSELELVNRQQRNPVNSMKKACDFNDDTLFELIHSMLAPRAADRPNHFEVSTGLSAAAVKMARKKNLKSAMSRLSRKLHEKISALQTGEFIAPSDY